MTVGCGAGVGAAVGWLVGTGKGSVNGGIPGIVGWGETAGSDEDGTGRMTPPLALALGTALAAVLPVGLGAT
jgi:hypothetical protein